ncbi:hypothetical protein [Parashewanella tropica]|uniref:hypothetical protein n=1 Tax=Parashewanella tropica TaxID=2547970 RepID=UPI001059651C|nr:hypothetical protein [Parashewanella tropica]
MAGASIENHSACSNLAKETLCLANYVSTPMIVGGSIAGPQGAAAGLVIGSARYFIEVQNPCGLADSSIYQFFARVADYAGPACLILSTSDELYALANKGGEFLGLIIVQSGLVTSVSEGLDYFFKVSADDTIPSLRQQFCQFFTKVTATSLAALPGLAIYKLATLGQ